MPWEDLMVEAYILVQTEVGKAADVASLISKISGVTQAEDVTGPYDVIVRAQAERGRAAQVRRRVHVPAQPWYAVQAEFGGAAGGVPRPGRQAERRPERRPRHRGIQRGAVTGRVGDEGRRPGRGGAQRPADLFGPQRGQVGGE